MIPTAYEALQGRERAGKNEHTTLGISAKPKTSNFPFGQKKQTKHFPLRGTCLVPIGLR